MSREAARDRATPNMTRTGTRVISLLAISFAVAPPLYWRYRSQREDALAERAGLELQLECGVRMIPKKGKTNGGEDAYFVLSDSVGVFDGVGGWARHGVDAGIYARALAASTAAFLEEHGPAKIEEALTKAAAVTKHQGSSTACVIGLVDGCLLRGLNLGDSGLAILRQGSAYFKTKEQQFKFNHPYQLGTYGEPVSAADPIRVELQVNDTVVLGTDGLFDNVTTAELAKLVERTEALDPADAAAELAELALRNSEDPTFDSPFAQGARAAGYRFDGGKEDDITVVLCRACEAGKGHRPKARL